MNYLLFVDSFTGHQPRLLSSFWETTRARPAVRRHRKPPNILQEGHWIAKRREKNWSPKGENHPLQSLAGKQNLRLRRLHVLSRHVHDH